MAVDHDAVGVGRDDECGQAAMTLRLVRRGEDGEPRRMTGVRDEHLRAVEDVVFAVANGGRLDARDVRAGIRLGQREGRQQRLLDQLREPGSLLLLRAGDDHRPVAEPVRCDRGADARAAPAQLLADQHPLERAELEAAVCLGHMDVHQTQLVRLREHLGRVRRALVVLAFLRPDLALREVVREVAQRLLLVGQAERDPAGRPFFERRHLSLE